MKGCVSCGVAMLKKQGAAELGYRSAKKAPRCYNFGRHS